MSVIPAVYNFPNHYKGSSIAPIHFKCNFDITDAEILCQIKEDVDSPAVHEWITGTNITIVDPLEGKFILHQVNKFDPPACRYIYDLQITFPNGNSQTYIKGKMKVIQDITV